MKLPRVKTILITLLASFAIFYLVGVYIVATDERTVPPRVKSDSMSKTIAIFGASGTAGDGILKAALESDEITNIHVITRRVGSRMADGVKSGKIELTRHFDYLDYSSIIQKLADVDAVYWAIGISALGTDEQTYGMIHTDFPLQFVKEWSAVSNKESISFHFISSSDISEESDTMWIREKIRAEKALFGFAENSKLKVVAYRPDYIGPTAEEAHPGQHILYWFFEPVGAAVKATQIGQAMIEVTARHSEFSNGDKLATRKIIRFSDAYEARLSLQTLKE